MTSLPFLRMPRLFLVLTLLVGLLVGPVAPAQARGRTAQESAAEQYILNHHNSVRSSALTRSSDLDAVARSWADRMASDGQLRHNPNLSSAVTNWLALAENVGYATGNADTSVDAAVASARRIADAYMQSSGHRTNLLNTTYSQVGIGAAIAPDGTLWNAVVFRQPAGATSSPSAPAPTSKTGTQPATTGGSTASTGRVAAAARETDLARQRAADLARAREAELARVRTFQEPLKALGWYDGAVDGVAGPVTRQAVEDFQVAVGLPPTGEVDEATLAALTAADAPDRASWEAALQRWRALLASKARTTAARAAAAEWAASWTYILTELVPVPLRDGDVVSAECPDCQRAPTPELAMSVGQWRPS